MPSARSSPESRRLRSSSFGEPAGALAKAGVPSPGGDGLLFACVFVPQPPPKKPRLVELAREFSPRVEEMHDWLVLLDVSGLGRLIGMRASGVGQRGPTPRQARDGPSTSRTTSERAWRPSAGSGRPALVEGRGAGAPAMVGFEIGRAALGRGWVARVAVASTRVAALLLAQARPGLTVVPPGDEARTLAPLPIEVLEACRSFEFRVSSFEFRAPSPQSRVPSPEMFITFRRWGLRTLGELAALPPADLSARLGPEGPALQRLARGQDLRPLVPVVDPERFEASFDLEWPIEGLEPLSFVLARVLEPLCARLERADRGAAALTVGLTLTTRETHARTLQLPAPLRDARALRTLALLDLESHPPPAGIDQVAVAIEPAPGPVTQFSLIEHPRPSPERLSTLVARLGALMGEGRVGAPALVDTHRPGAFGIEGFDPERATTTERTRNEHGTNTETQRLGRHQSPIGNEPAPGVVRRFRVPLVARVAVDGGRPVRVTMGRRDLAGGRIDEWAGPWRASGGWWDSAGPWDRDEWDVLAADGVVYRLFRDRAQDRWFIEGIVD